MTLIKACDRLPPMKRSNQLTATESAAFLGWMVQNAPKLCEDGLSQAQIATRATNHVKKPISSIYVGKVLKELGLETTYSKRTRKYPTVAELQVEVREAREGIRFLGRILQDKGLIDENQLELIAPLTKEARENRARAHEPQEGESAQLLTRPAQLPPPNARVMQKA